MRAFIAFFILTIATHITTAQTIRVMTYNIRMDTPQDGMNAWPKRVEKVAALIQKYNPDVIGIQEALHHQLEELLIRLPGYSHVGVGRDDGKEKGEYSAILFRNSRFGLLATTTHWLSETPEIPGSKSWDAAITRVVTVGRFFDRETKLTFSILNTHFDHIGMEARLRSASYIAGMVSDIRIGTKGFPVIVTGDFNAERDEATYSQLANDDLLDTKPANDPTGTFCGFEVGKMNCRAIDYIFHTKEWVLKNYLVIKDNDGKYYPSDHLPVLVDFELATEN